MRELLPRPTKETAVVREAEASAEPRVWYQLAAPCQVLQQISVNTQFLTNSVRHPTEGMR